MRRCLMHAGIVAALEEMVEEDVGFVIKSFNGDFLSKEGEWEKVPMWSAGICFKDLESVEKVASDKSLCGFEVWMIMRNEDEAIVVQKMIRIGEREYKIIHD